jgi:hypothetical protein
LRRLTESPPTAQNEQPGIRKLFVATVQTPELFSTSASVVDVDVASNWLIFFRFYRPCFTYGGAKRDNFVGTRRFLDELFDFGEVDLINLVLVGEIVDLPRLSNLRLGTYLRLMSEKLKSGDV